MIVTRKCHKCGKKNRFDKSKIDGTARCKRCGKGIRRTEETVSLSKTVWMNFTGYLFYNKPAILAAALIAAAGAGGLYYWSQLSQKEEAVQQTPPPIQLRDNSKVESPETESTPVEPANAMLKREPRRFAADLLWPETPTLDSIPVSSESSLIAASGSPVRYVRVDDSLFALASGKKIAELPTDGVLRTAVSQDGALVAAVRKNDKNQIRIALSNTADPNGEPTQIEPGCDASLLGILTFCPTGGLVVQTKSLVGSEITVWNSDGTERIRFETALFTPTAYAVAPDVDHLAMATVLAVEIYDLETGKRVAVMDAAETGFPISMCGGLAFSPDGREIAALAHMDRLVIWNAESGAVVLNHILERSVTRRSESTRSVEWMPDGRGWLINGTMLLLDKPLSIVWDAADASVGQRGFVVDTNHVLVQDSNAGGTVLVPVSIPWPRIKELPLEPLLTSGQEVEVLVLHRDENEKPDPRFVDALKKRCRDLGLKVVRNAPVKLLMEYDEKQGNRRPFENGNYVNSRGRIVYPTEIDCRFTLSRNDTRQTLWTRTLSRDGGHKPEVVKSAAHLRTDAIISVVADISTLNIPSRIINDPDSLVPLRRDRK
ncbi:MAG: hypothetical protein AB8G99_04430 [Planctomycetaceae bacterium]